MVKIGAKVLTYVDHWPIFNLSFTYGSFLLATAKNTVNNVLHFSNTDPQHIENRSIVLYRGRKQ